jgi:hypothetical protein
MRRLATTAVLLAVASIVLLPTAAFGKGASEATISGPGLEEPIVLAGEGQAGGELLMAIADEAGFFPAVFSQIPDPMLDERPAGTLGPKYTVTYVMPGPNGEEDTLVQDLYPYASPSLVSYVEPGQPFWTTEETRGGWYVASAELKDLLVTAGLPESPPADGAGPSDSPWTVLGPIAVLIAVVVVGALGIAVIARRGPQPA